MQAIKKTALGEKYHNELHCNEVMLLPYYIARRRYSLIKSSQSASGAKCERLGQRPRFGVVKDDKR